MTKTVQIYLDESGDLGWSLNEGSSNFITLAAIIAPSGKGHLLAKIVRDMYKARSRPLKNELKSTVLSNPERTHFIQQIKKLKQKDSGFQFLGITVSKTKVNKQFQKNPNALYNYMAKIMLLSAMNNYSFVEFFPDQRSIKIDYKYGLHQYLEQQLFEKSLSSTNIKPPTVLTTTPSDSKYSLELQAADFLASVFWRHFEHGCLVSLPVFDVCSHQKLFFHQLDLPFVDASI